MSIARALQLDEAERAHLLDLVPGDTGQRILIYSAEPGSPSQQALDLLASWARTPTSPPEDEPADER